jgi:hypothetical protein
MSEHGRSSTSGPSRCRLRVLGAACLLATACASTAPYAVQGAAINTALAVGAAALERASGGCFADCAPGTICNTATGFCEPQVVVCVGTEAEGEACRKLEAQLGTSARRRGDAEGRGSHIGISPATGSVLSLPPAKASPENP